MTKDARNKLRDMGGIMASSPELIQAVQKFQVGGPVMGPPPVAPAGPNFAPRIPPAPVPGIRPTAPQVPPLAGTIPVVPRETSAGRVASGSGGITMLDWREMSRREREAAGFPVSEIGGQLFFDRFGVGMGLVDPDARFTPEGRIDELLERSLGSASRLASRPEAPPYTEGDVAATSRGRRPSDPTPPSAEYLRQEAESLRDRASQIPPRRGSGAARSRLLAQAEELESQARVDTTDDARAGRGFGRIGDIVQRAAPDPEKVREVAPKIDDVLSKTDPAPDPGNGDGAAPAKPNKRDLRSRYNEKIELFKEIYGTDDKDEAQDRAMNLAMIGLAIAAGQSPNALTNIAQGAMVGLQGMSARQEAERERERGLRTLALETAIDQQAAEAEAETEAAQTELEQANKLQLEEFKAQLGALYGGAGGSRDARNIIDFTQNTYNEALKAASAATAPDFDPKAETPHQYAMRQARAAAEGIGKMFPGYGGGVADGATPEAPTTPETPGGAPQTIVTNFIAQLREKNIPDERIRQGLIEKGYNPADYGL